MSSTPSMPLLYIANGISLGLLGSLGTTLRVLSREEFSTLLVL